MVRSPYLYGKGRREFGYGVSVKSALSVGGKNANARLALERDLALLGILYLIGSIYINMVKAPYRPERGKSLATVAS